MKKYLAALAAATILVPAANAATVTYGAANPGGTVTLTGAGPGAVASPISFDVSGLGDFTAIFTFTNPFSTADANGSASFNFDPDVLLFTNGMFSGGGSTFAVTGVPGVGSSIQVDSNFLPAGVQTLTLTGRLNTAGRPVGGNNFARVGGSITLTDVTAAVPEPAAWSMLVLGFGVLGGAMRTRARKSAASRQTLRFV